ncbi:MAG: YjzC family protein [Proteobacteria bacterium]|nr:YjzC family protein [Pseudomonadota bacterium]
MANTPKNPGSEVGNRGGIYQEIGPRGGKIDNYVTVSDGRRLPPTSESGHTWKPVHVTPDSPDHGRRK